MPLWFIEGADAVDVSDPRWGTKACNGTVSLVGFITVFKFCNLFGRKGAYRKLEQNETHRICQALVFPPTSAKESLTLC
ncbi:hypothetical protein PsorP6_014915 [Peronosclerospora sorghi]|uniref:Uncharacterized protein n=1 Tax=Peronosclerospora sorghi TaxID=230839 RepID=A0ACC0VS22_9STRA|nr:hypothetical protein PsorP6_014915 [Peronosclerospora sorghi]